MSGRESITQPIENATPAAGGTQQQDRAVSDPRDCLERVRERLVEIEALAHAAAQAVANMPFVHWPETEERRALQTRLNYARLPFLVMSTADAAQGALVECVQGLREWTA